jgi:phosphatidylglycerophosphate synthase
MKEKQEKPERRKFRQETVIHSYIVRPLAFEIVRLIWNTNIKPNHLTLFRILLNILAVICFASANFVYFVIGFFLFQLHEIIDHADGMYARMKGMTSKMGVFLEHFFDAMFSASYNLLGLSIAFSGYVLTDSLIYFYLYIAMAIGNNIAVYYKRQFSGDESKVGMTNIDHDNEVFLSIFDKPLKTALKNILTTMFVWQNQFLLWGVLLYFPIKELFEIDTLLIGFVIVVLLNQLAWIYWAHYGFAKANKLDRSSYDSKRK